MDYYVEEIRDDEIARRNAAGKARNDVNAILQSLGMQLLPVRMNAEERGLKSGFSAHMKEHLQVRDHWMRAVHNLQKGDCIFVQFPSTEHSIFLAGVFRRLKKRGIHVVLIIHDLEILRLAKGNDVSMKRKVRCRLEELNALKAADAVIVHNEKMADFAAGIGIDRKKLVSLGIFDYLFNEYDPDAMRQRSITMDGPVIIAGNLHPDKAKYVYALPTSPNYRLYGVSYQEQDAANLEYMGSFLPEELPYALNGSFGLVWDGVSADTCSGIFGEYLKINNPHKTSLYLASELPVIIWRQAALADFIQENHCGIVVESLRQIPDVINSLSKTDYEKLKEGTAQVAGMLRGGSYLKHAVEACKQKFEDNT